MIKRDPFGSCVCIHERLLSAGFHAVCIREVVRISDPMCRTRNLNGQITYRGLKIVPKLKAGERALCLQRNSGVNNYHQLQLGAVADRMVGSLLWLMP